MSTNKMKGLLKGLRYISQIFDNEKEPEMEIGFPTDVKHVAHIGWDGPSVHSPSWMNEFKTPQGFSSAPLSLPTGEVKEDGSVKWVSEDSSSRRSSHAPNSPARDLPELPRASRRLSTGASAESPTREKSDKPKTSRRASKNSPARDLSDSSKPTRQIMDSTLESRTDSPSRNLPDIPKKSRRKKSKESSVGGSTRLSRSSKGQATENYASSYSDPGSGPGTVSRLNNGDHCQSSTLKPFEEGEEKGVTAIS